MKNINYFLFALCAVISANVFSAYIDLDAQNFSDKKCFLGLYKNDVPAVSSRSNLHAAKIVFYSKPDVRIKLSGAGSELDKIENAVYKVIAVVCGKKHYVCNYDHRRDTFDLHMTEERELKVEAIRHFSPDYTTCRLPGHRYQS